MRLNRRSAIRKSVIREWRFDECWSRIDTCEGSFDAGQSGNPCCSSITAFSFRVR